PQVGHQISYGERHSDRLFGERLAVRRNHVGAGFDTAARQRNVCGDDDVAGASALRDPVIGGVHARPCGDALDQRVLRYPDEAACNHADGYAKPERDAINLVLYRAGIGVDIDAGGRGACHAGRVVAHSRTECEAGDGACQRSSLAYHRVRETTKNQGKRAWPIASRPTTPRSIPRTRSTTIRWRGNTASQAVSSLVST